MDEVAPVSMHYVFAWMGRNGLHQLLGGGHYLWMRSRDNYRPSFDKENYWTPYIVKIQVFNDKCLDTAGCPGPMSEEVEVMSAEDLPQVAPTKVGARPFNSTAIKVQWQPIPNVREKVDSEQLRPREIYTIF